MKEEWIRREKEITYTCNIAPKNEEMKNVNKTLRVMEDRLRIPTYIQAEFLSEQS